jgi:hypothetical protein
MHLCIGRKRVTGVRGEEFLDGRTALEMETCCGWRKYGSILRSCGSTSSLITRHWNIFTNQWHSRGPTEAFVSNATYEATQREQLRRPRGCKAIFSVGYRLVILQEGEISSPFGLVVQRLTRMLNNDMRRSSVRFREWALFFFRFWNLALLEHNEVRQGRWNTSLEKVLAQMLKQTFEPGDMQMNRTRH